MVRAQACGLFCALMLSVRMVHCRPASVTSSPFGLIQPPNVCASVKPPNVAAMCWRMARSLVPMSAIARPSRSQSVPAVRVILYMVLVSVVAPSMARGWMVARKAMQGACQSVGRRYCDDERSMRRPFQRAGNGDRSQGVVVAVCAAIPATRPAFALLDDAVRFRADKGNCLAFRGDSECVGLHCMGSVAVFA